MLDDITTGEEESSIFETFSDFALCSLAVTLALVGLLAITITQDLDVFVNRNTFSGGVMRPTIHLECTAVNFLKTTEPNFEEERILFGNSPYIAVHLFAPSLAQIKTNVQQGDTTSKDASKTFAKQLDFSLYRFLLLAPGIKPGSFLADGNTTALLIPSILNKQIVYEPNIKNGYSVLPTASLSKRMLAYAWPIYQNPVRPVRNPQEYSQSRTRIYIETETRINEGQEEHYVIIGHSAYRIPDALEDGSLAWLSGFSSGLTEIIYLGSTWSDPQNQTGKRIAFFENAQFNDAAAAYRNFVYPQTISPSVQKASDTLEQKGIPPKLAKEKAIHATAQTTLSAALLSNKMNTIPQEMLPPLFVFPDAWNEYIQHCTSEPSVPPNWFYDNFLVPLGFDLLAIDNH